MKKRKPRPAAEPEKPRERLTLTCWIVAATLLIVPLIFDPYGEDNFRLPKELALRASAIALLVSFAFWATRRDVNVPASLSEQIRDPVVVVTLAIVVWTGITTMTSLNRRLSADSFITVAVSAIFFLGCRAAVKFRPLAVLDVAVAAAAGNAFVVILQRTEIWQPFLPRFEAPQHVDAIGFLGNTNDVGAFLLLPAIAALMGAVVLRGKRQAVYGIAAVVLILGLAASYARTAIAAYVAAVIAAAVSGGRRLRWSAFIAAAVILVGVLSPATELGRRYWTIVESAMTGDVETALSSRMPSFLAAVEMIRDRPVTGTGPGTFKWLYMQYRIELKDLYPKEWLEGIPGNFVEVHNDHLQVAAESGIPGYLLLIAAALVVVRPRGHAPDDPRQRLQHRLRLPFVLATFVLMLAHFPLQTASGRVIVLLFAALTTVYEKEA